MKYLATLSALALIATAPPGLAQPKGCPPGLAKKSPACVPPGQARKADRDGHDVVVGKRIDAGDYRVILEPTRFGLPPAAPGTRYYAVDRRIVRVDQGTLEILELVDAVRNVLD